MSPLRVYAVFHLNLLFSSIETHRRREVLDRCYWPLVSLAEDLGLPLGLEASGMTLEILRELDPCLLDRVRKLTTEGGCEFLGSGHAQMIGPLVPAAVNRWNLELGQDRCEALLGHRPRLAFVNEQAWSAGLVDAYCRAGFDAAMTEWNNAARAHPDWPREWRFHPQRARGPGQGEIPVIWNDSIAFQKLQRLAHGETDVADWLAWVEGFRPERHGVRHFCLYGGDAEVFDFRPARYAAEPTLETGEWERIREAFARLAERPGIAWVAPSRVLEDRGPDAGHPLRLESAELPCLVKKQRKYNLSRWAVTGRDDLAVNSACHRIARALEDRGAAARRSDWQELCELWSSDFRTHITEQRWQAFRRRLARAEARLASTPPPRREASTSPGSGGDWQWSREGSCLRFESDLLRAEFELRRGLALRSLCWKELSPSPLVGTLPHGLFDDIAWAADYFTGHFVYQRPGRHQITDLTTVEPSIPRQETAGVGLGCIVATELGPVEKHWQLDPSTGRVLLRHRFHWPRPEVGSLRFGHVTLVPGAFDACTLGYATCNGGAAEHFDLTGTPFEHGRAVSSLVSSSEAVGLTEGWLELGDRSLRVRLEIDPGVAACIGQVHHQPLGEAFFVRATLSAREFDDTSRPVANDGLVCSLSLTARRC